MSLSCILRLPRHPGRGELAPLASGGTGRNAVRDARRPARATAAIAAAGAAITRPRIGPISGDRHVRAIKFDQACQIFTTIRV